jgi:DNA replication and repair protein RecF
MKVTSISLEGFKNYSRFTSDFSDNVNVIAGSNAQGKTNLIEAVYFLSAGRSSGEKRPGADKIRFGCRQNQRRYVSDGRNHRLEATLSRTERRRFTANGVRLKAASELSGKLRTVLFCPDDLNLIREGAAVRRRLLDGCLCQLRPRYAAILTEFNRVLEQKTRILKDHRQKPSLLDTLTILVTGWRSWGRNWSITEAAYAALLTEKAAAIHGDFSGGSEKLSVRYCTVQTVADPSRPPSELLEPLLEHLRSHRRAELESGTCLSGAIRMISILKSTANRPGCLPPRPGQNCGAVPKACRTRHPLCRPWRIPGAASGRCFVRVGRPPPELCPKPHPGGQVFITCCDDVHALGGLGGKLLRMPAADWRNECATKTP